MNVYYLPSRTPDMPETVPAPTRWSIFQARTIRFWWRVRLTASDVWSAARRGGRAPLDEHVWFAEEPPVAPRRRVVGPARVLHLDDARRRRQLAAVAASV